MQSVKKIIMLFFWFLKFGFFTSKDEYSIHDYIKERFSPKYISPEEFDEKEQLLRDTPGPVGIKYAYYVGNKVCGVFGAVIAIFALLVPVVAIALIIALASGPFITNISGGKEVFNGMHAAALGLVIAQIYKIVYFNQVNRKSMIFILPAAAVFIGIDALLADKAIGIFLMPYFVTATVIFGVLFGIIHVLWAKYREKHPKFYNPYSKKAIKMRDRQIREEEENMRRYIDEDDSIKRRREQLEKERSKELQKKKYKDGE